MDLTTIGIMTIVFIAAWWFGGFMLRACGALLVLLSALKLAAMGDPVAVPMLLLGAISWLLGHWHFALRHLYFKSALAEYIFEWLPRRFDPTLVLAAQTAPEEEHRGR